MEAAGVWALTATLVLAALRLETFAELAAVVFAGMALWSLLRSGSARSRLQTGIALPLLLILSTTTIWPACYLGATALFVGFREEFWLARLASLLTMLFPAGLWLAANAYLHWIGYRPFWMPAGII